jgi:tRNA threonylcarbamoyladenosine biosynthesis protein TsaB
MSNTTSESADEQRAQHGRDVEDAPLTLCVDSATDVRCVAVARGAQVISLVREASARGQSSALLEEIDEALRSANISLQEIELYAITTGPGSFTGLRTGIATIKAFASVHARTVAPVPTLHVVALSAGASEQTLALMPAGRGEVFAQMLSVEDDGRVSQLTDAAHVNPESVLRHASSRAGLLKLVGGGAHAHVELVHKVASEAGVELIVEEREADGSERAGAKADKARDELAGAERVWLLTRAAENYAAQIARLGLISYREGRAVGARDLAASYVRPSDAELNERWHR